MKTPYLDSLRKRGFPVKIGPTGGLVLSKDMPAEIKEVCRQNRRTILTELRSNIPMPTWTRESGDPRDDLTTDHELWNRLLRIIVRLDIYPLVHFMRCMGAALTRSVSGWRIVSGEMNPDEFAQLRGLIMTGDDLISRAKNPLVRALRML